MSEFSRSVDIHVLVTVAENVLPKKPNTVPLKPGNKKKTGKEGRADQDAHAPKSPLENKSTGNRGERLIVELMIRTLEDLGYSKSGMA